MNIIVANKNSSILNSLDIDIIKSLNGEFSIAEIVQLFSNFFFEKIIIDITAIKDIEGEGQLSYLTDNIEPNKIIIYDNIQDEQLIYMLQSSGIYNIAHSIDEILELYNNPRTNSANTASNQYNDSAYNLSSLSKEDKTIKNIRNNFFASDDEDEGIYIKKGNKLSPKKRIIGFKNATSHAGATSLIYMLIKDLKDLNMLGIELTKHDFTFLNNKNLVSASKENLTTIISRNGDKSFILIDLNNENIEDICDEVIYLVEPSTIMLNKMVTFNNNILNELKDKKVVLNKSLLNDSDVRVFNKEAELEVLYNIKPLNDKLDNSDTLREFMRIISN